MEQFEVLVTLDTHTCGACGDHDHRHYDMKDFEIGVTAPPFHPNCRCTTSPFFDDEAGSYGERTMRRDDKSKTEYVPRSMTYKEWKEKYVSDENKVISGAVSGARNPYGEAASKHAAKFYDEVRKRTGDVNKLAETAGLKQEDVQAVKNYIFMDRHDLGGKAPERFAPDYMMGESWRRLSEGKPEPHDFTLLKHEQMEYNLVAEGCTQYDAHILASRKYNYSKEAEEFYGKIKKYKKE